MKEILTVFILILAVYPLKNIHTLFRICKKRKNSLNMFATIIFGVFYLTLLFILNDIVLQSALIVIVALIADKLIKKYMALISHEENEKRLDSFEAFIKAYEQQKRLR